MEVSGDFWQQIALNVMLYNRYTMSYCTVCLCYRRAALPLQEKRIYDLKKKNQELEKFKFVLDYKIKELRKQIEPRENEIKRIKEQIKKASHLLITSSFHTKKVRYLLLKL